ncbi:MAG: hypothetical protein N2234_08985 [Planctomycetota bacterium]|nr:hypothetical protein [Planctomycetota bacterium]
MRMIVALLFVVFLLGRVEGEEERNSLNILCFREREFSSVDEMIKAKKYAKAAELLHQLLSGKERLLLPKGGGLYVSAEHIIRQKNYPDEVKENLAILQRRGIEEAIKAMREKPSVDEILSLFEKYPFSGYEEQLLLPAGDILFEKGDPYGALRLYQRVEKSFPAADKDRLFLRLAYAQCLVGNRQKALDYANRLSDNAPLGHDITDRNELRRRLARIQPIEFERKEFASPWRSVADSVSRVRFPLEKKLWVRLPNVDGEEEEKREIAARASPFPSFTLPFYPSFEGNRLYVPLKRGILEINLEDESRRFFRCPNGRNVNDVDTLYCVTVTENEVFSSFPVGIWEGEFFLGILVRASIAQRAVAIFDRKTAKYKQFLHEFSGFREKFEKRKWSFPSPPVVRNERAYCEVKTLDNACTSYIAVFDLKEKRLVKAIPLCSNGVELTMFGYAAREPLSSPPVSDGESLYLVTNLGVVCCFSLRTEEVVWLREYSQLKIKPADGYHPDYRMVRWASRPPLLKDGVLIFTPLDSQFAYAVEAETGELLWQWSYNTGGMSASSLVGVCGDDVLFSGQKIGIVGLRSGKLRSAVPLPGGGGVGLGAIADTEAFIPSGRFVALFDVKGETVRQDLQHIPPGNILVADKWLVVVDSNSLSIYQGGEKRR